MFLCGGAQAFFSKFKLKAPLEPIPFSTVAIETSGEAAMVIFDVLLHHGSVASGEAGDGSVRLAVSMYNDSRVLDFVGVKNVVRGRAPVA